MTKKHIESRKDVKIEQEKTYLFIGNLTYEQVTEITSMISTSFERFDDEYDDVMLVCHRGVKFGGY